MASSPSHRFGQIIGDMLEYSMIEYLKPIADEYSLYLDYRHARKARNGRREVRWGDINGNTHKLDIVMENNGTELILGEPRVFIEIAWRRYTKHSKNKAQEISGAISPLIAKYRSSTPFFGAIVAGEFTQNSLEQMISEGFEVLYISLEKIIEAFSVVGIDAYWEENTSDFVLQQKVDSFESLNPCDIEKIKNELLKLAEEQLETFRLKLCNSLERKIEAVRVISVFGDETVFADIKSACAFLSTFNETKSKPDFYKFEIYVRYSNGDRFEACYSDKSNAILFLQSITH
jgi:hypothetical protein